MLLTLLGAWVGAFTLPLDWDREWQVGDFSQDNFSLLLYTYSTNYCSLLLYAISFILDTFYHDNLKAMGVYFLS
jgi:hypothetical protein